MEHVMDEETKKKMRGLLPYSDKSICAFTPEAYSALDVDDKYKPIFYMRGLTREEHMQLMELTQSGKSQNETTLMQLAVLRGVVTGWKNLFDAATGTEIAFSTDSDNSANSSVLFALHYTVQINLIGQMYDMSGLIELDKLSLKS